MKREDAEKALRALDGKDVKGYAMRVGWGKAVPMPLQPIYGKIFFGVVFFIFENWSNGDLVLDPNAKPKASGLPFNAQVPNNPSKGFYIATLFVNLVC